MTSLETGGNLLAPKPHFLSKVNNNNNNNSNNNNNNGTSNSSNSRPASFTSSTGSSKSSSANGNLNSNGGRVQLQSSLSYMRRSGEGLGAITNSSSMTELELREEFIIDGSTKRETRENLERPLETVNRLSRMWDTVPASISSLQTQPTSSSNRRVSRLPLAVGGFDPYGYGVSTEPSPYDSALAYSSLPKMSSRASWYPSNNSDENGFMTSNSFVGLAMMGGQSNTSLNENNRSSSRASGDVPWAEKKRRSVSLGEMGTRDGRSSFRNSFLGVVRGPSKLSGEISVDGNESRSTLGVPGSKSFTPPADQDFLKSKLYQRTLKAQKSLDKERAKKDINTSGSRSINDSNNTKSTGPKFEEELRAANSRKGSSSSDVNSISGRSVISNDGTGGKNRKSLGWFRSKSEVALSNIETLPSMPPIPTTYRRATPSPLPSNSTSPIRSQDQLVFDNNNRSKSRQSRQSDQDSNSIKQHRQQQQHQQQTSTSSTPMPSPPLPSQNETRSIPSSPSSFHRRNLQQQHSSTSLQQQQQQQHQQQQQQQSSNNSRSNSPIIDYYSQSQSQSGNGNNNRESSASFVASQYPLPPSPSPKGEYFSNVLQNQQQQQSSQSQQQQQQYPNSNTATNIPSDNGNNGMRERARSPLNSTYPSEPYSPSQSIPLPISTNHSRDPSPPTSASSSRLPITSTSSFEQDRNLSRDREREVVENASSDTSNSTTTSSLIVTPLQTSLESIHPIILQPINKNEKNRNLQNSINGKNDNNNDINNNNKFMNGNDKQYNVYGGVENQDRLNHSINSNTTGVKKNKSSLNLFFGGFGSNNKKNRDVTPFIVRDVVLQPQPSTQSQAIKSNQLLNSRRVVSESKISTSGSKRNTSSFFSRNKKPATESNLLSSSPSPPTKNTPLPAVPIESNNKTSKTGFNFLNNSFSRSNKKSTTPITTSNISQPNPRSLPLPPIHQSNNNNFNPNRDFIEPKIIIGGSQTIMLHSNRSAMTEEFGNDAPRYNNVY